MMKSWERTLDTIKTELTPHVYNTWLKPLQYKSFDQNKLCIEVPNQFYKDKVQQNFSKIILDHFKTTTSNQDVELTFALSDNPVNFLPENNVQETVEKEKEVKEVKKDPFLGSKYKFESFVVGNGNQLAHAAAMAVSEAPGQAYNPLFVYGGVGLGKTHLLSAIGNKILQLKPNLKVVYRTSEQFTNDVINSIRFEKMQEFRARYRDTCDVLLLDDIQFLSKKERTQEEFFHTFNTLQQAGKQVVLTSDRMPSEIPDLDERLRSRFQSGLFCDIQKPDVETRVAILRKKLENQSLSVPDSVLFLIAENVDSNIRVLEGCLTKIMAEASLYKKPVDDELAKKVVFSLSSQEKIISTDHILSAVSSFFHLKISDLKSARRHKVVAQPRQIAMYLARKMTPLSFPELGQKFGGKDHTTVLHGYTKIQKELETNPQLRSTLMAIEKSLHS